MERDKFLMQRRWVDAMKESCESDSEKLMVYDAVMRYAFEEIVPVSPRWLRLMILLIKDEIDESIYELCAPQRTSPEYREFRKIVLNRDGCRCQMCGATDKLHVHHIRPYSEYLEGRTDPNNAVTLCADCHRKVHSRHGDL